MARAKGWPLHAHVSEQPAENEACLAAYGRTPTQVLADAGALGAELHRGARHPSDRGRPASALASGSVCLCPTTERDLADGVAPAVGAGRRRGRRCAWAPTRTRSSTCSRRPGPSSSTSAWSTGRRGGIRRPACCCAAATAGGAGALGWPDAGRLEAGRLADFVTVGLDSVRLAGTRPGDGRSGGCGLGVRGGRPGRAPRGGRRARRGRRRPPCRHRRGRRAGGGGGRGGAVTTTVVDHIGLLVTNDPTLGDGPLGLRPRRRRGVRRRPRRGRRGRRGGGRPAPSTPEAAVSSPASWTATPTWCSPATGATSSPPAWPARRTRRVASSPRWRPPGPPPPRRCGPWPRPGWPPPGVTAPPTSR